MAGPTLFIFKMTTNSVGLMFYEFLRMNTWTDPLTESRFIEDWTVFYWALSVATCVVASVDLSRLRCPRARWWGVPDIRRASDRLHSPAMRRWRGCLFPASGL